MSHHESRRPPPIPFTALASKVSGMKELSVKVRAGKGSKKQEFTNPIVAFDGTGTVEDWFKWMISFSQLVNSDLKEHEKFDVAIGWLDGEFKLKMTQKRGQLTKDDGKMDSGMTRIALDQMTRILLPMNNCGRLQHRYLIGDNLYLGGKVDIHKFRDRLNQLSSYLPFFPPDEDGTKYPVLTDQQKRQIVEDVLPPGYNSVFLQLDIDPVKLSYDELVKRVYKLEEAGTVKYPNGTGKHKNDTEEDEEDGGVKKKKARLDEGHIPRKKKQKKGRHKKLISGNPPVCDFCGNIGHVQDRCHKLQTARKAAQQATKDKKQDKKQGNGTRSRGFNNTPQAEQMFAMFTEQSKLLNKAMEALTEKSKFKRSDNDNSEDDSAYSCLLKHSIGIESLKSSQSSQYPPTTEVLGEARRNNQERKPMRILIDTGSTQTIVLRRFVAKSKIMSKTSKPTTWNTLGGSFSTKRRGECVFTLPEFSLKTEISFPCHVDDTTAHSNALFDMIMGRDLIHALKLVLDFDQETITWDGHIVPMKKRGELNQFTHLTQCPDAETTDLKSRQKWSTYTHALTQEPEIIQRANKRTTEILDAQYKSGDLQKIVSEVDTLVPTEQQKLLKLLKKFEYLFDGTLGSFDTKPLHFDLNEKAKSFHSKAYPVPHIHARTFKRELERLVEIGVLRKVNNSDFSSPTFIIPKKNGTVRLVSDFRKLNTMLKRRPYPIPHISHMLQELQKFSFATSLDLNMGYYTLRLDSDSQKLCTIVTPFGKYQYLRLPMGISCAPDMFQERMSDLMSGLEFVRTYLDDLLVITAGSFEDHLTRLELVLQRLADAGLRCNIEKSNFCANAIEYLGFWITRDGIQPMPKKVEAIHNMTAPTTRKQLRRFIGMVNYYRDMWRKRSDVLTPLTALTSKSARWKWTDVHQKAFEEVKRIVCREVMLAYPDFDRPFQIYTDASDYQLGAVVMQDGKPLAFYSRKLNSAQKRYTTTEQELLSIVETLKEYKNILLGHAITIYTDHKNLTYDRLTSDRVLRWRLLIEEFGPTITYIKGKDNVIADTLSRNTRADRMSDEQSYFEDIEWCGEMCGCTPSQVCNYTFAMDQFPMDLQTIAAVQGSDSVLQKRLETNSQTYKKSTINGVELIVYKDKIFVPKELRERILAWYHEYLLHPGALRTEQTIKRTMYWSSLAKDAQRHCKKCKTCQLSKVSKKYGQLPPKTAESCPWERVCVDLIGPFTVKTPTGDRHLLAFTAIDPATSWFEICAIPNKEARTVMDAFHNTWLCRYPRPSFVSLDNGGEFKQVFKEMCDQYGIQLQVTTSHNPQANSMIERVHAVLNNMLRTFSLDNRELNQYAPWDEFIHSCAWAIRSTYHSTLQATPGELVFGRDMIHDMAYKANWDLIRTRKQQHIVQNNARENASRVPHTYSVGDRVMVRKPGKLRKLESLKEGPYPIVRVFTNGSVTIQKGVTTQRINIRRIEPYHGD